MSTFTKIIHPGTTPDGHLFCKIELNGQRLSIGVVGPQRNGNCRGSCGQIIMSPWAFDHYAPGWNANLVAQFRATWERWHLNDMRAGSPAQHAYLAAHPVTGDHYAQCCDVLRDAGLNPDPDYLHNGQPYAYGSAWLFEPVPADVIAFLESLPESDLTPAWV